MLLRHDTSVPAALVRPRLDPATGLVRLELQIPVPGERRLQLWIAGDARHGFCYITVRKGGGGGGGGCGKPPLKSQHLPVILGGEGFDGPGTGEILEGRVGDRHARRVELRLDGGGIRRAAFRDGGYLAEVPAAVLARGHEVTAVLARDAAGHVLGAQRLPGLFGADYPPPPLNATPSHAPSGARLGQRVAAARLRTPAGAIVVWTAPGHRAGRRCTWLTVGGRPSLGGCDAGAGWLGNAAPLGRGPRRAVVLWGMSGRGADRVVVRFQDGRSRSVRLVAGAYGLLVPRSAYARGHRPMLVQALDQRGHVLAHLYLVQLVLGGALR